jgi:hypothetical protein
MRRFRLSGCPQNIGPHVDWIIQSSPSAMQQFSISCAAPTGRKAIGSPPEQEYGASEVKDLALLSPTRRGANDRAVRAP